jgi:amino acid permease
VGTAVLFLPRGVASAGVTGSVAVYALTFVLFVIGTLRLVESWLHYIRRHDDGRSAVGSYAELTSLLVGPMAGALVKLAIVALQMGCCVCYFIFVSENAHEVLKQVCGVSVDQGHLMVAMLLCEVPLSLIRDIRSLACTNSAANVIIALCLSAVFVCAGLVVAQDGVHPGVERGVKADSAFLFLGTCIFAFDNSTTMLPVAGTIAPKDRGRYTRLYVTVVAWIGLLYLVHSVTAYLGELATSSSPAEAPISL